MKDSSSPTGQEKTSATQPPRVRYGFTIHPAEKNEEMHSSAGRISCLIEASEDQAPFPTTLRAGQYFCSYCMYSLEAFV